MFRLALAVSIIVGLAVGSFLNVVIHRVPAGESVVRPRSSCPGCGHPIRARHMIPVVSWIVLAGRCADCAAPISPRYPLVEVSCGGLFVAVTVWCWHRGLLPLLPALAYLAAIGLALALIDIATHRLPNAMVGPSYPVMVVLLTAAAAISGDWWALMRAGIGMVALFGFFALLALIYPAGMGWGDVKLAGVLGLALGYCGWSALVVGTFAGFCLGALVAVVMMVTGRGTGKTALPFGPFMLIGAAIGVAAGDMISAAYLGVVGV